MSYKTAGDYEMTFKNQVPFYWNNIGLWQVLFTAPFVISLNIISLVALGFSIISPIVNVQEGGPLWSLFFMLLAVPSLVYPSITTFVATQPKIKAKDYSWSKDVIGDLRVNEYLALPKETRQKLKPLAKEALNNKSMENQWATIVDEYSKLLNQGVLESKNKALVDSIKLDLEAQQETRKIMKENGWLK